MKYLFTYNYKGKNHENLINGSGSTIMTVTGTDKITPSVIQNSIEIVTKDLNSQGIQVDAIAPMGWFKYDEEETEDKAEKEQAE